MSRRGDFRYTKMFSTIKYYKPIFRASGGAILGTLKYLSTVNYHICFVRASGEAILGTLKYVFTIKYDFKKLRASGEAILVTLKYVSTVKQYKQNPRLRRGDFRYTNWFDQSKIL